MAQVMAGAIPVCVGGILVAGQVVTLIFGSPYAPATAPLRILLLLVPAAYIRNVSQGAILAHARQDLLLRTVAWAAGTNVLLNLALIPRWGMTGAAVATVLTEGVRTMLAVSYARRLEFPMTRFRRFVPILVAAGAMGGAVAAARGAPVLLSIPLGAAAYALVLALLGGIRFRRGALPELSV